MAIKRVTNAILVALLIFGGAPSWVTAADSRLAMANLAQTGKVRDVALGPQGTLSGQVAVSSGGLGNIQNVYFERLGRQVAQSRLDANGEFQIHGLRGGSYMVLAGESKHLIRCWSPGSAPPNATESVLIVVKDDAIRGQGPHTTSPMYEWMLAHPIVTYSALTAAIVIPVIKLSERKDSPSAS